MLMIRIGDEDFNYKRQPRGGEGTRDKNKEVSAF
jgi:hypothetical protein